MQLNHLPGIVLADDDWDKNPDQFTQMVEKGRQGLNYGFSNGLVRINDYLYGTHRGRYYLIGADSGVGKCLGKGTKVIMHDGTLKAVEDVKPGDKLMGPDSKPRNVLSTCTGIEQMYWVHQKRGMDYRVNESHILSLTFKPASTWTTKVLPDQAHIKKSLRKRSYERNEDFQKSTVNVSVRDYLQLKNKALYHGWKAQGIEFGKVEVFDPYLMGLWLGDGTSATSEITNTDQEVIDYMYCAAEKLSLTCKPKGTGKSAISYRFSGKVRGENIFLDTLKRYDLLNNKHIPQDYICSSYVDRLELLAGLIDSDGYYNHLNDQVEICQVNKVLAEQITFLVRSLGYYTTMNERISTMKRKDGSIYQVMTYRVSFSHCSRIPCLVIRKQSLKENNKTSETDIVIEKDKVDYYYGFVIDGDHLFMLEDFTVTHNTTLADFMFVISMWLDCRKKGIPIKIVYLSFEISKREKMARWVSTFIYLLFGQNVPSDYIMGRVPGLLVSDEHMEMVKTAKRYVNEFLKDCEVIEGGVHPTWVLNHMIEVYKGLGTIHRDSPPKGSKGEGFIKGYTPKNPQQVVVKVCDHLALGHPEKNCISLKSIIDKFSVYDVFLRNTFDTIIINLQQFATDLMTTHRMQKKGDSIFAPQRVDFGDSKYTYRDADVVFGLVSPVMFDEKMYKGYDIEQLINYFLALHLMKHRYGRASRMFPLLMNPIAGVFEELPTDPANLMLMQPYYDHVNKLEQICQLYSPKSQ